MKNCENSLIFSLLAGYLMRRRVRSGLPPPPRTLLPAGLLHALPNCASVQRFSAAVSEVLRLWLRAGARFPRLSTARLRLLETVSRRRKQRPVRERRRLVRKHLARVCQLDAMVVSPVMMDVLVTEERRRVGPAVGPLDAAISVLAGADIQSPCLSTVNQPGQPVLLTTRFVLLSVCEARIWAYSQRGERHRG